MKRFFNWQVIFGLTLIILSATVYFIHYLIFRDLHHIFIYLIGDIAFVFIEVLLVTLVLHQLLHYREKKTMLNKLNMVMEKTKNNDSLILNLALNYGSRTEIVDAVRNIAADCLTGKMMPENIDENVFTNYLYTKDIPDPDLLIRTSGEMRLSNFLLWQMSYTEIYVTKKLWPDFTKKDFKKAMLEYRKRERRYGG